MASRHRPTAVLVVAMVTLLVVAGVGFRACSAPRARTDGARTGTPHADAPTPARRTSPTQGDEPPAAPDADPSRAELHVTVRTARGAVVAGAIVEVRSGPAPDPFAAPTNAPTLLASCPTDDAGHATLVDLAPDTAVRVVARVPGRLAGQRSVVTPGAGTSLDVEVLVGTAHTLRGHVRAPDGAPLEGAVVQIGDGHVHRSVAAPDGRWELPDLPWGTHEVRAARRAMRPLVVARVDVPLATDLDLVLEPPAVLTGTVTDAETGAPLEGVHVSAGIFWGLHGHGEAVSDTDGRYAIDTLPTGIVNHVTATRAGYRLPTPDAGLRAVQIGMTAGRTTVHELALLPSRGDDGRIADARLHGIVRGPDGPVAGVTVRLQGGAGRATCTSGDGGAYEFAPLVPGEWSVFVLESARGLYDAAAADASRGPARIRVGVAEDREHDIALVRGVTLNGRVVTTSGDGIAGARFGATTTDADGRFRLAGLRPGEHVDVYVEARGFVRALHAADVPESGDGSEVTVVLERCGTVRGTVTCDAGELPGDVRVRVVARTGGVLPGPSGAPDIRTSDDALPDADGRYTCALPWTTGGEFVVEAEAPGRPVARSAPVRIERGHDVYEVDVRIEAGATLQGVVLDAATDAPLAGAFVRVGGGPNASVAAVSAADGTFVVRGVTTSAPRIGLFVSAWDHVDASVNMAPGDASDLTVRLERAASIAGRVVAEDGAPVAGVRVSAGTLPGRTVVTGADGAFEIRGLPRVIWSLDVEPATTSGPAIARRTVEDIAPDTRDLVVLVHPGLRIAGRVVLADGRGAADVMVRAVASGTRITNASPYASTSGDGRFVIAGLAAGAYDVTATPNTRSPYAGDAAACFPTQLPAVRAGDEGVEIVLRSGWTISGSVVDARGERVSGLWLEAGGATTQSAHDGTFTFSGLRPGRHTIRAVPTQAAPAFAAVEGGEDVAAGARDVRLVAVAGASLGGRVVDAAGVGVEGADVDVAASPRFARRTKTARDGTYSFDGLPPGPYTLTAATSTHVPARVLGAAAGTAPDLVLAQGLDARGRLLDADGAPLAGCWLDFVIDGEEHLRREARTRDDGGFTVGLLAARPYRVVALVPVAGSPQRVDVGTLRGGDVDVDLRVR